MSAHDNYIGIQFCCSVYYSFSENTVFHNRLNIFIA